MASTISFAVALVKSRCAGFAIISPMYVMVITAGIIPQPTIYSLQYMREFVNEKSHLLDKNIDNVISQLTDVHIHCQASMVKNATSPACTLKRPVRRCNAFLLLPATIVFPEHLNRSTAIL